MRDLPRPRAGPEFVQDPESLASQLCPPFPYLGASVAAKGECRATENTDSPGDSQAGFESQLFFLPSSLPSSFPSFLPSFLPNFLKDFIYLFLERQEGKENKKEKNTWPTIQACAPTENRTGNLLVCRLVLKPHQPHQPRPTADFCCIFLGLVASPL